MRETPILTTLLETAKFETREMSAWKIVEWAVLGLCLMWTIVTNIDLRQYYKNSNEPALAANAAAMVQFVSVFVVTVFGYSAFHLLWLVPISYFAGCFFALHSKFFGRLAWLYGYVILYTTPRQLAKQQYDGCHNPGTHWRIGPWNGK